MTPIVYCTVCIVLVVLTFCSFFILELLLLKATQIDTHTQKGRTGKPINQRPKGAKFDSIGLRTTHTYEKYSSQCIYESKVEEPEQQYIILIIFMQLRHINGQVLYQTESNKRILDLTCIQTTIEQNSYTHFYYKVQTWLPNCIV